MNMTPVGTITPDGLWQNEANVDLKFWQNEPTVGAEPAGEAASWRGNAQPGASRSGQKGTS
jgi:hypothetical protein